VTGVLLLLLAASAPAGELGGHAPEEIVRGEPIEDREAVLREMWRRGLLAPDQQAWSPADWDKLLVIRRAEPDALDYLKRKPGGIRPHVYFLREAGMSKTWLTKGGYERYRGMLTQDAIVYFESKGADAKQAFKLVDWDGRRMFDQQGQITEAGAAVYRRAKLKLEVYWRGPDSRAYGTRRPPTAPAAAPATTVPALAPTK
jgi:hypothetical protein